MPERTPPVPDATPRENIHEQGEAASGVVAERFDGTAVTSHHQDVVYVDRGAWHDAAELLRDEQRFSQCVDVTAVDHLTDVSRALPDAVSPARFEIVGNFLSHARNLRVRVIAQVPDDDPTIASLTDLYPGVNFAEREVYDLFGITFTGHPGLTRILMPDDWVGHPLRKDDPPAAIPVTFKGDPLPR